MSFNIQEEAAREQQLAIFVFPFPEAIPLSE
jgi:hypothetical protein